MTEATPNAEELYAKLLAQLRAADLGGTHLVGIHKGGTWVAERLAQDLGIDEVPGVIDISFYRDDYARRGLSAEVKPTQIGFEVAGARVLLIDDVLYTGRTIRGATNVLFDYGRPSRIELAVLAERDGRELPIAADYSGGRCAVPPEHHLVLSQHDAPGGGKSFRLALTTRAAPRP